MTPIEETVAKECCKKTNACSKCPLYNPKRATTECYEFWRTHSPLSPQYESEETE